MPWILQYYRELTIVLLVTAGIYTVNAGINKIEDQAILIAKMEANMESQNNAINQWRIDSFEHNKAMQNLAIKLGDTQTATNKKIADIMKAPAPISCPDSMQYLKDNLGVR